MSLIRNFPLYGAVTVNRVILRPEHTIDDNGPTTWWARRVLVPKLVV